jgi:hypothetical protein
VDSPPPSSRFSSALGWLRRAVPGAWHEFREKNLRWSYIALGVLIVIAGVVNLTLAHGWTAWPFVAAAGLLMYVHEAAERNGQGVPPGHVYAWFAGVVAVWLLAAAILSIVNPFIVLAGVGFLLYYALAAWIKDREKRRIIDDRRAQGRCIFCGELADPRQGICLSCGEEPDPLVAQTARVQAVVKNRSGSARARSALKQDTLASAARKKEANLLNKSALRSRRKK